MIFAIDIPEPYRTAMERQQFQAAADLPATDGPALYARGLARREVGREHLAREDFLAAAREHPAIGDACRLELLFLDLRAPGKAAEVAQAAREIARRNSAPSILAGWAWHVVGIAENKRRDLAAAADALMSAAQIYHQCSDRARYLQVLDTLGTVQAGRGRLEDALHHYALSLAGKAALRDRKGMAISLGNLGRVQLQMGRFREALDCFRDDLALAREMGDLRGVARILNDIGRAWLALSDLGAAEQALQQCVQLAEQHNFRDIWFFANKDIVQLHLAAGRPREAERALAQLSSLLPANAEPYWTAHLEWSRGRVLSQSSPSAAVEAYVSAANQLQAARIPDLELEVRLELARVEMEAGRSQGAEESLWRCLRLAQAEEGYRRFLPRVKEAMAALGVMEPAIEETGRALSTHLEPEGDLILRETLTAVAAQGGFGRVRRVYDSRRMREVALKELCGPVGRTGYDPRERELLLASARRELQAGSRVHHPGVGRVLAIGTLADEWQTTYVLQDWVEGQPLSKVIVQQPPLESWRAFQCLADIAYALAALHVAGVIHRDLKPANIILRPDGQPVLIDFGIAHVVSRSRLELGGVGGTRCYMSLEQALGKRVDGRSDLYALGVVAYEWLSGVRPLDSPTLHEASLQEYAAELQRRRPDSLAKRRPDLPAEAVSLVMSLLELKPGRRPQTALETADQFLRLARQIAQQPRVASGPLPLTAQQ